MPVIHFPIYVIQLKQLDLSSVRSLVRTLFPKAPTEEQRLYLDAAISYIHYKAPEQPEIIQELRTDMALAHPIHPQSGFARELREEHQKGLELGLALDKISIIDSMLANGLDWALIQKITQLDKNGYESLKHTYKSH